MLAVGLHLQRLGQRGRADVLVVEVDGDPGLGLGGQDDGSVVDDLVELEGRADGLVGAHLDLDAARVEVLGHGRQLVRAHRELDLGQRRRAHVGVVDGDHGAHGLDGGGQLAQAAQLLARRVHLGQHGAAVVGALARHGQVAQAVDVDLLEQLHRVGDGHQVEVHVSGLGVVLHGALVGLEGALVVSGAAVAGGLVQGLAVLVGLLVGQAAGPRGQAGRQQHQARDQQIPHGSTPFSSATFASASR